MLVRSLGISKLALTIYFANFLILLCKKCLFALFCLSEVKIVIWTNILLPLYLSHVSSLGFSLLIYIYIRLSIVSLLCDRHPGFSVQCHSRTRCWPNCESFFLMFWYLYGNIPDCLTNIDGSAIFTFNTLYNVGYQLSIKKRYQGGEAWSKFSRYYHH